MKLTQVAAQLYTLRDFLKTPDEIAASLKKVREIGYTAVQVSGMGPIPEADLLTILDGEGLTLCATHEPSVTILNEPEKAVERLKKLNCRYTAYPYPVDIKFDEPASFDSLIERLNRAGKLFAENDLVLTYHNHNHEFVKIGGKRALDLIYERTNPKWVQAELDTYWVHLGGCECSGYCRSLKGRLPLLHLKDYQTTPGLTPHFAEIGNGNLPFKEIIAAAEESGCQWFIVEQDTCPGDPFDSLRQSFNYIKTHLVS